MALENKLGLTSSADLAREEERLSKKKAVELFENGKYLFEDIYAPGWQRVISVCAADLSGGGTGQHRRLA